MSRRTFLIVLIAICAVMVSIVVKNEFNFFRQGLLDIKMSQLHLEQRLVNIESRQAQTANSLQNMRGTMPNFAQRPLMPTEDFNKVYTINAGNSSVYGNPNAKVTIVEFSDFQCPYSQKFHPATWDAVKAYPNDVKYILKDFPLSFHPNARPAAKAALAAREQGKYWEMVEALFANGKELSEDKYKDLAKNLGLNVDKFMKDYKDKDADWEKLIQEDMDVAQSANVRGTPTFFINGKLTQARDFDAWKSEIEKNLKGQ